LGWLLTGAANHSGTRSQLVSGAYTNTTKDGREDQLRFFMQEFGVPKDEINQLFVNVNRPR
jgi:hypothetical protein